MSVALSDHQLANLTQIRRQLHATPDLSGQEQPTATKIRNYLAQFAPSRIVHGIGGAGVAAVFDSEKPGASVMIRCELDGLPITETGNCSYRSQTPGRGHQCGHDGHMAIVLGVAAALQHNRPAQGRIILLFQPAEEIGTGARSVIADPLFDTLRSDFIVSLHNLPGFDRHRIVLKSGQVNCASRGMRIRYTGKTAHASMPEAGVSPAAAMASTIQQLAGLSTGKILDDNFALATVVHAVLGEKAFGVSPGDAEIWATLRTIADDQMQNLIARATEIANLATQAQQIHCSLEFDDIFHACTNDAWLTDRFRLSSQKLGLSVTELDEPLRFSEDFGEYANTGRSAMFFLGSGTDHPALHNPDYDFPDELIRTGTTMFMSIATHILEDTSSSE